MTQLTAALLLLVSLAGASVGREPSLPQVPARDGGVQSAPRADVPGDDDDDDDDDEEDDEEDLAVA